MSEGYYSDLVRRHFFDPVRPGIFAPGEPAVLQGRAGSRRAGAQVQFQLRVADGVVRDSRYLAYGCPHTLAAASWVNERLPGMRREQVAGLRGLAVAEALKVPAEKLGSILVVEDALAACLEKWPGGPHV